MPEEVKVIPAIIIPSLTACAEFPKTSILKADLNEVRIKKFLLEAELQIPPSTYFSRIEIDQILKNIPSNKSTELLEYIRTKIVLNQFDQAETWTKACLESPQINIKCELYLVLAEVNYHQGYFQDTEFYLVKSNGLTEGHPLFPVRQLLVEELQKVRDQLDTAVGLSANDRLERFHNLQNPPFLAMLKSVLDSAYIDFSQKEYLSSCRTLDVFDRYFQALNFDKNQDIKLLNCCLSLMIVASRVGTLLQSQIDSYEAIGNLLTPLHPFYSLGVTSKDLNYSSELIRSPILKLIKEHAPDFIDASNTIGVALFQVGVAKGDGRFFQLARDVFSIQTQLSKMLYPNVQSGEEARIHVLTSLNNSDIALAREDLGASFKALASSVKAINRCDEHLPINLAAASSLRLGAMTHALYVHLGECLRFAEHSRTRQQHFPEYLREKHPEYLGIWEERLNGVRPLTEDDLINLNLKACSYQGESAYSYRQFAGFPKEVKLSMLKQSNWSHDDFVYNMLALSKGTPPKQHFFIPLELELAS